MRMQQLAKVAACGLAGLALSMSTGLGPVFAQSAGEAPGIEQPGPPGVIVTPPRPLPQPLLPDARYRSPDAASPDGRSSPDAEPRSGGCRYQEQKLELIV